MDIGSVCIVRKEEIDDVLLAKQKEGKTVLEPFRTYARERGLPFVILEDSRALSNEAEVHKTNGDLWHCLEGQAEFVYGGQMVNPWIKTRKDGTRDENELLAKEISGGATVTIKQGDWLWIPAGVAHQHRAEGVARFVVIKVPRAS
jgi:mannose-6-phosphate isomerase-like protein (cupin superfamily)